MGPEFALAASARDWPDRLHRFLLDHGGGRVRSRIMGSEQALADEYEVLFIDDICSFLNQRLVRTLREHGREIVGVYSPGDGPDAKRYLLECGITDVIESEASPEEFIAVAAATLSHRPTTEDRISAPAPALHSLRVGVLGAAGGVGVTEVAIGVASGLARSQSTVLVDLDQANPGIAQRLDLPLYPNLMTAVDLAHHSTSRLSEALVDCGDLSVVGGVSRSGGVDEVRMVEVQGLIDELAAIGHGVVVADLGAAAKGIAEFRFDLVLAVGVANPVGVGRLVRMVSGLTAIAACELVAVVNRVPTGHGRGAEIRSEWVSLLPDTPLVLLPDDRRVTRSAWDGTTVARGPFAKSVAAIGGLIDEFRS